MTILALYKLLLYGGFALLVGSLVALEVFLNWKYPLPPDLGSSVVPTEASEAQRRDLSCQCFVALAAAQKEILGSARGDERFAAGQLSPVKSAAAVQRVRAGRTTRS